MRLVTHGPLRVATIGTPTDKGAAYWSGTVEHLVPIAQGQIVSVEVGPETCRAKYRITDVPKGVPLRVTVDQQGLPVSQQMHPTPPGVDLVELSAAAPTKAGVDFTLTFEHGVL